MATEYILKFTDKNPEREFTISPTTVNGPKTPTDNILATGASAANTSIVLIGKGRDEYGEQVANTLLNMLENFSSENSPVYPISGQLWFDTNSSQLHVYDAKHHTVQSVNYVDSAHLRLNISTTTDMSLLANLYARGVPVGIVLNLVDGTQQYYQCIIVDLFDGTSQKYITINVSNISLPPLGTYDILIGDWIPIRQENISIPPPPIGDIDLQSTYTILNPTVPTSGNQIGDVDFNDSRYLQLTGGTITGQVTITTSPVQPQDIVNKLYVDTEISNNVTGFVSITGDTMTGPLTLYNDPVSGLQAATKQYVDNQILNIGTPSLSINDLSDVTSIPPTANDSSLIYNTGTGSWNATNPQDTPFILKNLGIAHSSLTLDYIPIGDLDATNVKYVNDTITKYISNENAKIKSRSVFTGTNSTADISLITALGYPLYYTVGLNEISVFVNGQKYITDSYGTAGIYHDTSNPTTTINDGYTPESLTGYDSTIGTYPLIIDFDYSGFPIVIDISATNVVVQDVIDEINAAISNNGTAFIVDNNIIIASSTMGSGSNVDIIDNTALLNLQGDDISTATPYVQGNNYVVGAVVTYNSKYYTSKSAGTLPPPIDGGPTDLYWRVSEHYNPTLLPNMSGVSYDYSEVGGILNESNTIRFNSPIPTTATIEVIKT